MACKHLGQKPDFIDEMVGENTPSRSIQYIPICMLGRSPGFFGWLNNCKEVSENDGCWFWNERNPNKPDAEFSRKR